MPSTKPLTIGKLARETGVKIVTIRYYEQIGLMPVPSRTDGNYRTYSVDHRRRLHFIRRCRDLGFTELVLNRRLALGHLKRFEFVEVEPERPFDIEPGLEEFLKDQHLSGDTTDEEIEFLKRLRFKEKRPAPLYYYRELQNLRDPLHFSGPEAPKELH